MMRALLLLAVHLLVILAKLMRPGGAHSVIAESLLLKHQLIISRRSSRRAPPLSTIDRFVLGLTALFVRPRRIAKVAAVVKPSTLLRFHKALVDRRYRRLYFRLCRHLKRSTASRFRGEKLPTRSPCAAINAGGGDPSRRLRPAIPRGRRPGP